MNSCLSILASLGVLAWSAAIVGADAAPPKAAAPTIKSVSGPITHGNLTIFLLHGADVLPGKTILTLQEALEQKKAVVLETSQVNELAVENKSDTAMLFIQSGDIVKGGKQDRAIAFDMLLSPKSGRVALGSFCVESGRWRQRGSEASAMFISCPDQITGKDLKAAVIANTAEKQGQVWKEVGKTQQKLSSNVGRSVAAAASPSSLQLSLENKHVQEKLASYEKALRNAADGKSDVIGMALCVNGKVEGAEVYGSAALFQKLWPKLLKSAATDAIAQLDDKKKFDPPTAKAVEAFLTQAAAAPAKEVQMAGVQVGNDRQTLNLGINAPASHQAGIANAPAATQRSVQGPPARIRIVRFDGAKVLLVESQDKDNPTPIVLHRCYIAK